MTRLSLFAACALGLSTSVAFSQDLIFPIGEGDFNWESLESFQAMDLDGEQVTVLGTWLGPELTQAENVLAYFRAATGADVRFSGIQGFSQQIVIDVEAGSPPNLAIFPQPGLAADMARRGFLTPLGEETRQWVRDNYAAGESWVDLGSYTDPDGEEQFYGLFYKISLKSLVWYVPENFEDAGYEVPETMEELKALTDQIVADGSTPWCIGLGSGAATGWPATDWVEEMLLRTQPPEVYDAWVTNEIPFTDERVVGAIDAFGAFARNEDYVAGGVAGVASTDFRDSPKGLFAAPPQCYLHRQGSFLPSFFPEGTEVGVDADFFYFPAYEDMDLGSPVLGAGNFITIMDDSPGARALLAFFQSPIAHELWMAQDGFVTPHIGANADLYATDMLRRMGEILLSADTFRFDGSDLMPGSVGTGSFWTGMIDYMGGDTAAEVAAEIQAGWDANE